MQTRSSSSKEATSQKTISSNIEKQSIRNNVKRKSKKRSKPEHDLNEEININVDNDNEEEIEKRRKLAIAVPRLPRTITRHKRCASPDNQSISDQVETLNSPPRLGESASIIDDPLRVLPIPGKSIAQNDDDCLLTT